MADPRSPERAAPPANPPQRPADAREMLDMARGFLERKGVDEPRREAELLVARALGLSRLGLYLQLDRPLVDAEVDAARDLLVRRGRREPVAYIVGEREFYGRPFRVGPGVLVPRPETELLVDRARERAAGRTGLAVIDLGTGSGCIALTLALELDAPRVTGVDLAPAAVACARANAAALGCPDVEWLEADMISALEGRGPFDLVVANPPYVPLEERSELQPEVRDHEPDIALYAPRGDPDHWVRRLLDTAPARLAPGGTLLVELGHDQGARASRLARDRGLTARVHQDLAHLPRVLEVEAPAASWEPA